MLIHYLYNLHRDNASDTLDSGVLSIPSSFVPWFTLLNTTYHVIGYFELKKSHFVLGSITY